jgi:hypothetical protein
MKKMMDSVIEELKDVMTPPYKGRKILCFKIAKIQEYEIDSRHNNWFSSKNDNYGAREVLTTVLGTIRFDSNYKGPQKTNFNEHNSSLIATIESPWIRSYWSNRGIEILGLRPYAKGSTYSNECCLTIPKLKEFCSMNSIKYKSTWKKIDYLKALMKV